MAVAGSHAAGAPARSSDAPAGNRGDAIHCTVSVTATASAVPSADRLVGRGADIQGTFRWSASASGERR